jgi:hypothetical protein
MVSDAELVKVPRPVLPSVLSKVAAFAIFATQILRNKQTALGDKSTAKSAL